MISNMSISLIYNLKMFIGEKKSEAIYNNMICIFLIFILLALILHHMLCSSSSYNIMKVNSRIIRKTCSNTKDRPIVNEEIVINANEGAIVAMHGCMAVHIVGQWPTIFLLQRSQNVCVREAKYKLKHLMAIHILSVRTYIGSD